MKDRTHFLSSPEWHHRINTLGMPRRLPYFAIAFLVGWVVIDTFRYEGSITGKVVNASTRKPMAMVEVHLWNRTGKHLDTALTDENGVYTLEGLRSGMYYAATVGSGLADKLYRNRPCPAGECDPTAGYPILVEGDDVTKRINFSLGP